MSEMFFKLQKDLTKMITKPKVFRIIVYHCASTHHNFNVIHAVKHTIENPLGGSTEHMCQMCLAQ